MTDPQTSPDPPDRPLHAVRPALRVYLAGPVSGVPHLEAVRWRDEVRETLSRTAPHVTCLDPLRDRCDDRSNMQRHSSRDGLLAAAERDLWDVRRADVVLMNFAGAKYPSVGSIAELGWASAHGKYVIVILPGRPEAAPNPHDHTFVRTLATYVADNLDQALARLSSL